MPQVQCLGGDPAGVPGGGEPPVPAMASADFFGWREGSTGLPGLGLQGTGCFSGFFVHERPVVRRSVLAR